MFSASQNSLYDNSQNAASRDGSSKMRIQSNSSSISDSSIQVFL